MSVFTPIDDDDTNHGDLLSVELFAKIADNVNYLIDSNPVGKVIMVLYGLTSVPLPDPNYWQLCDGSPIIDPLSPLVGFNTPDYTDVGRFLRGFSTLGQVGNFSGSHTKNLSHSHGGATGADMTDQCDNDNDFFGGVAHVHSITPNLGSAINFEPPHTRILHFIKIR